MQVVGADKLAVFLRRRDAAAGALRVFYAIAAGAEWKNAEDVRRQFGPAVRFAESGAFHLTLPGYGLRIDLQVNYGVGLLRIAAVDAGVPRQAGNGG